MIVNIEINFVGESIWLNYWDNRNGDDVVCEVVGGELFTDTGRHNVPTKITLQQFVDAVRKRAGDP